MRVVKAAGNGRCLFISLRLALECFTMIDMLGKDETLRSHCVNGHADCVIKSAETLCGMICDWYENGLSKEVAGFGSYISSGRPWTRRDILAMEMVQRGRDVPEEGAGREEAALGYIKKMRQRGSWGSTPEYTSFAFMSKLRVEVYQPADSFSRETPAEFSAKGLTLINSVEPVDPKGTVRLLFNGSNHYDLLLSEEDNLKLAKFF
jgi:hypothetical protein